MTHTPRLFLSSVVGERPRRELKLRIMIKNKVKQKPIDSSESINYYRKEFSEGFLKQNPSSKFSLCDMTSLVNYHIHGLEMSWGSIWMWDNPRKEYVPVFYHHVWNLDENDNLYDDFESLEHTIHTWNTQRDGKFKIDVRNDEYRYFDGSKLKVTSSPEKDDLRIGKILKKTYHKPLKTPKMIFVSEVGWDDNFNPYTWESIEERWVKMEKGHVVDYIQR